MSLVSFGAQELRKLLSPGGNRVQHDDAENDEVAHVLREGRIPQSPSADRTMKP